jgi:hypothetical protein
MQIGLRPSAAKLIGYSDRGQAPSSSSTVEEIRTRSGDRARNHVVMWPGNANLPIGTMQPANREIGVPGFLPTRFVPSVC